jgi:LysM domain
MANITQHLKSISLDSRSGSPPGRRLLALTLVVMLVLGSVFPGFALAAESDSEGEGTAPPVEVPVDPGFDPGGEEEVLEEAPAAGSDEETGAVEVEAEVNLETPPAGEVTSAATETAPDQTPSTAPSTSPEPAPAAPEPEPIQQQVPEAKTSEPVANQSIVAPKQRPAGEQAASSGASAGDAAQASEPSEEEAPSAPAPQPVATPPADHGRHLAGKDSYVVQSGDCLWHIAADRLPGGASDAEIAGEVARLWALNEDSIGTGDPSLLYAGTTLRLR